LIRVLPHVYQQECFALKGGTALNLFVRDLPRLSVDIDLTYPPQENYQEAKAGIQRHLTMLGESISANIAGSQIENTSDTRLLVRLDDVLVKVELSPVLRETVHGVENREVSGQTEELFGYAQARMLSFNDLYAGKICAALDRQHPRDLYDIKLLFDNEGLSRNLVETFLVYLISHNRPIAELLSPRLKDIRGIYESEFASMTQENVSIKELEAVRLELIAQLQSSLTTNDKEFLLSFKSRQPDWSLLPLEGIADLPAVKWKQLNLEKMSTAKHRLALEKLINTLGSMKRP